MEVSAHVTAFPPGFVWGAATSAHQTEGNNVASDWWEMEHTPGFPMVEPSGDACDSYHRYGEDVDLLAAAGLSSYRFGVEWARIEPAPGEFSQASLQHYQRMVERCWAHGVEPVVTLHHFTKPAWVRTIGAWQEDATVDRFRRYVDVVTGALEGVNRYCTINEPNVMAAFSGALDTVSSLTATPDRALLERFVRAHRHAVEAAHAVGARAGLTVAMSAYTTDGSAEAEQHIAKHRSLDEDLLLEATRDDDFIGVQAYTRKHVTAQGILPQGHDADGPAQHRTLTGWHYYPRAIGECLQRAHAVVPGTPLLVTENGIATSNDEERIAYTTEALGSVLDAIDAGVAVEGYYHWSLLDNFEWVAGYAPTFGLIGVDRETFERTPKPSLDWLGRVAKANALPS
jgi:beta-glucosidase